MYAGCLVPSTKVKLADYHNFPFPFNNPPTMVPFCLINFFLTWFNNHTHVAYLMFYGHFFFLKGKCCLHNFLKDKMKNLWIGCGWIKSSDNHTSNFYYIPKENKNQKEIIIKHIVDWNYTFKKRFYTFHFFRIIFHFFVSRRNWK